MRTCFTINPLRTIEEIRSYKDLFRKKLYEGIEIFYPYTLVEERIKLYKQGVLELLTEFPNIEVVMHLPFGKANNLCDLSNYENVLIIMKNGIDFAANFNTKKLTLHLGDLDLSRQRQSYIDHIKPVIIELCNYANQYNMDVMIENMPRDNELGCSPEEIELIIKSCNMGNLKFIFDIGHANVSGYKIEDYILKLKQYLTHIHLSDNDGSKDEHAQLGRGNIDFNKYFKLLDEVGYNKLYCFEVLYRTASDLEDNVKSLHNIIKNVN